MFLAVSANANAEVQTVAVDFSEGAEGGIYDVIGEALEGLEIGVLGECCKDDDDYW